MSLELLAEWDKTVLKKGQSCLDGLREPLLLQADNPQDEVPVFRKFPVNGLEPGNYLCGYFRKERSVQTQPAPVTNPAPDDAAQHVAPAFIAGNDAIADKERGGPGVFDHDPHGEVGLLTFAIDRAAQLRHLVDYRGEQVSLVYVVFLLQDDRRPFKSHAGVYAGGRQRGAHPLGILVVLHEHQVPKLDETLAVAIGVAAGHRPRRGAVTFLP